MAKAKKEQEFYLVGELANALRVSHMTIYRYIKKGKIQAYKIGKEFRIGKREFNSFLNKVKTK
jgi:excisionase family DNA binding protein